MNLTYKINKKLPTLNDYTNMNRTHWGAGASSKKGATDECMKACEMIDDLKGRQIILHYTWYVSTKHDYDNIAFAQKFVQDGLKEAGKISDDSPKYVLGFTHEFVRTEKDNDHVIVTIEIIT